MRPTLESLEKEAIKTASFHSDKYAWVFYPHYMEGQEIEVTEAEFHASYAKSPEELLAHKAFHEIELSETTARISVEAKIDRLPTGCIISWDPREPGMKRLEAGKAHEESYEAAFRSMALHYLKEKDRIAEEKKKSPAEGGEDFKPKKPEQRTEVVAFTNGNVSVHVYPDDRVQIEVAGSMEEIWLNGEEQIAQALDVIHKAFALLHGHMEPKNPYTNMHRIGPQFEPMFNGQALGTGIAGPLGGPIGLGQKAVDSARDRQKIFEDMARNQQRIIFEQQLKAIGIDPARGRGVPPLSDTDD